MKYIFGYGSRAGSGDQPSHQRTLQIILASWLVQLFRSLLAHSRKHLLFHQYHLLLYCYDYVIRFLLIYYYFSHQKHHNLRWSNLVVALRSAPILDLWLVHELVWPFGAVFLYWTSSRTWCSNLPSSLFVPKSSESSALTMSPRS